MILRSYLIRTLLVLFISFSFTEKSLSADPAQFIQSIVNEASKALITNKTKEEKMDELKSIAVKAVDIKGIGLYTLGSHRKNLSNTQKKNGALTTGQARMESRVGQMDRLARIKATAIKNSKK